MPLTTSKASQTCVEVVINGEHRLRAGVVGPGVLSCTLIFGHWLEDPPVTFELYAMQGPDEDRELVRWTAPTPKLGDRIDLRLLSVGAIDAPTARTSIPERELLAEAEIPEDPPAPDRKLKRLLGPFARADRTNARTIAVRVNGAHRALIGDSGPGEFGVCCALAIDRSADAGAGDSGIQLALSGSRPGVEAYRWPAIALVVGDQVELVLGEAGVVDEPVERIALPETSSR